MIDDFIASLKTDEGMDNNTKNLLKEDIIKFLTERYLDSIGKEDSEILYQLVGKDEVNFEEIVAKIKPSWWDDYRNNFSFKEFKKYYEL